MKRPLIKSFEGLRGIAALLVVLYHIDGLRFISVVKAGYLSVDLFFILSGFVMSVSYGDRLTNTSEFADFMSARLARLTPLLLASYALYFLIANVVERSSQAVLPSAIDVLATLSMTFGLGLPHVRIFNFASWSISAEFYTYVIFGLLWINIKINHRTACAIVITTVSAVILLVIDFGLNHCGSSPKACLDNVSSMGATIRCLCGFFAGVLAHRTANSVAVRRNLSRTIPSLSLAIAAISVICLSTRYGLVAFLSPVVFALLLISVSSDTSAVALALRTAIPQRLGRLSYSMYLLHMPLLLIFKPLLNGASGSAFLAWVAAFLGTLLFCAELTYRLVEAPGRIAILAAYHRLVNRGRGKPDSGITDQDHVVSSTRSPTRA